MRTALLLFFAVVLLATPQAALLPLLDRDEPRFAEASREMLQSGNIIVPTFNHAPRYAKPPLIYWCQALSFMIFGENAFAARLPSLLATAGTAVLLLAWGRQLGSEQAGLGAGLLYVFCLQTIQQGRVATADALLIFFMTLTVFAGWNLLLLAKSSTKSKEFIAWEWQLILGLAAGFLAKGPEAWLPFLTLLIIAPSLWRLLVSYFLLSLAFVACWAIPALIMTNGDYWRVGLSEGVGERMVTGLQGHGASSFGWYLLTIPLYLLLFWLSALPWSPLLAIYGQKLFSAWKLDELDRYLLLNAGLIFLIFSLMVTKLPHYTLPAFPLILLLFARRWQSVGFSSGSLTRLGWWTGIVFALFSLVFIPVALIFHATPSPVGDLVRQAQEDHVLWPKTQFAMVDFQEPNVVWEMRRALSGYAETVPKHGALSYLTDEVGPRAILLTTEQWEAADLVSDITHDQWKVYHARGFNAAKGSFIDLTLVVKQ